MYSIYVPRKGVVYDGSAQTKEDAWVKANIYGAIPGMPGIGAIEAIEYVNFVFPEFLKTHPKIVSRYQVLISAINTKSSPAMKYTARPVWTIGALSEKLKLPLVWQDPYARIGVVPDGSDLPSFSALLVPGGTYFIPDAPFRMNPGGPMKRWEMPYAGKALGI